MILFMLGAIIGSITTLIIYACIICAKQADEEIMRSLKNKL